MPTARQKIQAARTSLVLDEPFFGVLALRLHLVEDPSCQTAWTDGRSLGYSPKFVESLTHDELLGLVAHEVLHCANGHPWRRDSREPRQWNVACVHGDTPITLADGTVMSIKNLRAGSVVASPLGANRVYVVTRARRADMVELSVELGHNVICTSDHLVLTSTGFVQAGQVAKGQEIIVDADNEGDRSASYRHDDATGIGTGRWLHIPSGGVLHHAQRFVWPAEADRLAYNAPRAVHAGGMGLHGGNCGWRGDDFNCTGHDQGQAVLSAAYHDFHDVAGASRVGGSVRDVRREAIEHQRALVLAGYGIRVGDRAITAWDEAVFANQETARGVVAGLYRSAPQDAEALHRFAGDAAAIQRAQGFKRARVTDVRRFRTETDVYDLVTEKHAYVAGGVVVHNCDYAINYVLNDAHFRLPHGALRDAQFDGKSAEWIYARIPPVPPDGGGGKPGQGAWDVRDAPTQGDLAGATEQDWQQAVQQAAQAAKARGTLPASLARLAKSAAEPKVDWRSVLHRFVQQRAKDDYAWQRPNTRYLASGLYLPSLHSERVGPIAVAIDTSGSIDSVLLNQFAAEVRSVVDDVGPSRVHVLYCDAKVHRIDTFEKDDVVELNAVGGGGTAFAPVMDAVDAMEEPPVCLIYLTDLDGSHRKTPPSMPVLWATIQERDVPYGEVVLVE